MCACTNIKYVLSGANNLTKEMLPKVVKTSPTHVSQLSVTCSYAKT